LIIRSEKQHSVVHSNSWHFEIFNFKNILFLDINSSIYTVSEENGFKSISLLIYLPSCLDQQTVKRPFTVFESTTCVNHSEVEANAKYID